MNKSTQSSAVLLGPEGPLAKQFPGYRVRAAQVEMAAQVEQAIADHEIVVIEAGTGTGKTFAYLLPALLSGKKVIVSTGTKNLQDQLFHRDLPQLRKLLGIPAKVALLKGRANYLCHYRLDSNSIDQRFADKETVADYQTIRTWANKTEQGDIAEIPTVPEDSRIWPLVTSNAENCLNQDCPFYQECFLVKARRKAQQADVLVVNHHLFFADLALRQEGFGELLPSFNAVIFDEAHQLPDIASQFFGSHLTSRQLQGLVRDVRSELTKIAGADDASLLEACEELQFSLRQLQEALGPSGRKAAWFEVADNPKVKQHSQTLNEVLTQIVAQLKILSARSKGLESCFQRAQDFVMIFNVIRRNDKIDAIQWFECFKKSFALHVTPLNVAQLFQQQLLQSNIAWIFTSATLTVSNQFTHFVERLGLDTAKTHQLESPFDYAEQATLYCPKGMPDPKSDDYLDAVIMAAKPIITALDGKTFFLFTSYRALHIVADKLPAHTTSPLLIQGTEPKAKLLEKFVALGNAILLGTYSFWEGVDVRGQALSCVIIDKLPFASPFEPVMKARIQAIRDQGGDPFHEYQLPQAVLSLKQGAGRLIRDESDHGILMICDPRLCGRNYGREFVRSLPPMRRSRDLAEVLELHKVTNVC